MMLHACHLNDERILRLLVCPTAPRDLVKGGRISEKNTNRDLIQAYS